MNKDFLIAFDFDHTIVDDNSDLVAKKLVPSHAITAEVEVLKSVDGWTLYMQEIFNLLYNFGISEERIRKSIKKIPPVKGILELFNYLKIADCEVIIISDSNSYFIEEWLRYRGLKSVVNKIFTNPADFRKGRLTIQKYHIQDWCKLSSKNLCKGSILLDYISKRSKQNINFERIAYVGDGMNDYCPSLKLTHDDLIFPRISYPLEKMLNSPKYPISAKIFPWEDATSIINHLETQSILTT